MHRARRGSGVEAEAEPVQGAQPQVAPAAVASARASDQRVRLMPSARNGSGGNGSGFSADHPQPGALGVSPASRSSITSAPNRVAPTPRPV